MSATIRIGITILAAIALFCTFLFWLSSAEVPVPPNGAIVLGRAERLLSSAHEPPLADNPAWKTVTLPDSAPKATGSPAVAWYRIHVDIDPSQHSLWALYLRRPWTTVAVWVNGELVGDSGTARNPLPFYISDLRFTIPAGLARRGDNQILVRSVRERSFAYLGALWLGDAAQLSSFEANTGRYTKTYARTIVVATLVLSLVYAGLYAMRRRETAYGWFAAALMMWAIQNGWTQFDAPPITPAWLWRPVAFIALGWFVICAAAFVHRFAQMQRPRLERVLFAIGIVGPIALWIAAANDESSYRILGPFVWIPAVNVLGLYVGWSLLQSLRRGRALESQALAIVALFLAMVGIRDYLRDRGFYDSAIGLYFPYAAPIVLLVFGTILLRRFVVALDDSERLNRELEARVAEKSAAIEASFARIAAMESQRVHDGIGGQLVQALAMVERNVDTTRMREVIQSCLDDLRLIIDASATGSEDLGAVLASLRSRMRRRLEGSGVQLDWPLSDVAQLPSLSPHATLQVLRVLQEALSNALRHAHATLLRVSCSVEHDAAQTWFKLSVVDNGCGVDPATANVGRGIGNLRKRAEDLGGSIELSSDSMGTSVNLSLPIPVLVSAESVSSKSI
jgi:signal transduction histidine kinase